MSKTTALKTINVAALRRELQKRNETFGVASRKIGKSDTYLSQVFNRGTITNDAVLLLQYVYNIDPSLYVIEDEPEMESKQVEYSIPEKIELVWNTDKLYNIIYNACLNAFKKALNDKG